MKIKCVFDDFANFFIQKPMLWVLIRIALWVLIRIALPHNIGFYEEMVKIILQLSSNTHYISSSGYC